MQINGSYVAFATKGGHAPAALGASSKARHLKKKATKLIIGLPQ